MYIDIFKRPIISDNPAILEWEVQQALSNGEDLCANPFVFKDHFFQWVTQRVSLFEYKLVSALTPFEFADQVERMTHQGYELALQQVEWQGMLCQWMARMNAANLEVERASNFAGLVLPTGEVSTPKPVFKLVEHVQVLGSLSFSSFSFSGVK